MRSLVPHHSSGHEKPEQDQFGERKEMGAKAAKPLLSPAGGSSAGLTTITNVWF